MHVRQPMASVASWRVAAAGLSYALFGIGASIPALVALCLKIVPMSAHRRQTITRHFIGRLSRFYLGFMQAMGLFQYRVIDNHGGEVSGQLIIANHPMLIDALFVMAYLPNVCCIAKPGLARNPFTRLTLVQAGYVVSEVDDLIEQVCRKLRAGENVLIFPEGTRNTSDSELDFKRGAANLAVIAECVILPIVIRCRPRFLQKNEKWYQLPAEQPQISLSIEPSLRVSECIDTTKPRTLQYRDLTHCLREYYRERLS